MPRNDSTSMTDPPPPQPPAPEETTRMERPRHGLFGWQRSSRDRYLGGVAGGLADRADVDPLFPRIALVGAVLAVRGDSPATELALAGYVLLWAVLPIDGAPSLLATIRNRASQRELVGAVLAATLAAVVLHQPGFLVAAALAGLAIMLLSDRPQENDDATTTEPVPAAAPMSERERARTWANSLRPRLPRRTPSTREPKPRREPALWPLTLALLVAFGVVCAVLDNVLDPGLDPSWAVNGALFIVGGVLALSAWRGRAWVTIPLALALVPLWIAYSVAGIGRFDSIATATDSVRAEGQTLRWHEGYGTVFADLRDLDPSEGGSITAEIRVTGGQADVWVPRDADVHIEGELGMAELVVIDERQYWRVDQQLGADYHLDRLYRAEGTVCDEWFVGGDELTNIARNSGLDLDPDATTDDAVEAIVAAGYPSPVQLDTFEEDAEFDGEPGPDDEFFAGPAEEGADFEESVSRDTEWSVQLNNNWGLCTIVAPPANPTLITIDAHIGVGRLQVHRV